MVTEQRPRPRHAVVGIVSAGFVAGTWLSFGLLVLLFELAESGTNTRPWQAIVGWLLSVALLS